MELLLRIEAATGLALPAETLGDRRNRGRFLAGRPARAPADGAESGQPGVQSAPVAPPTAGPDGVGADKARTLLDVFDHHVAGSPDQVRSSTRTMTPKPRSPTGSSGTNRSHSRQACSVPACAPAADRRHHAAGRRRATSSPTWASCVPAGFQFRSTRLLGPAARRPCEAPHGHSGQRPSDLVGERARRWQVAACSRPGYRACGTAHAASIDRDRARVRPSGGGRGRRRGFHPVQYRAAPNRRASL